MKSVGDLLDRKGAAVQATRRDVSVLHASRQMNEFHIGALVVLDDDRVVGIFTERDILNRVVAAERDPGNTEVSAVMTSPVACCQRSTQLDECRRVMREKRIRHIPVVENDRLLGIISIGDVNRYEITEQDETIQYLHDYMHGRY